MAWIVAGITVAAAGAGVSAYGHLQAGQENARSALFEQQQDLVQQQNLEAQQQQIETASAQDEAKRRDALTSSLDTIAALRAERGVGTSSPTGTAILNADVTNAESDINASRDNYAAKADQVGRSAIMTGYSASMAGRKARTSLMAGYLGATSDILGGVSKGIAIGNGGYGGKGS